MAPSCQPRCARGLRAAAASSCGGRSSIVPTSVRTMWRRNESAVISSSSASSRRCHTADSTVRVKTLCCVSAGVKARKSCSPSDELGRLGELLLVERIRIPPGAPRLERRALGPAVDPVAIAARAGEVARVEVRRAPARRRSRPRRRAAWRSAPAPRARSAHRPRPRPRRPGRARARRCRFVQRLEAPTRSRRRRPVPPAARPRRCGGRAVRPSRGSRCRRTRALASAARQAALTAFVRRALCSIVLRFA